MKKLLLTALLASTAVATQAKDITFALDPGYPPFEITNEKGEIIGFDIDIANAICQEIKATCHFKGQAFDSLISGLKFKHFDAAISAMSITEPRKKQISFTAPYYDSTASFIAVTGKADLNTAKKVGVQNGTTFRQYIVAEAKQYQPVPYPTLQHALLDLKNGRIDIIFGDTAVLAEMIKQEPSLHFVGDKVENKKYFGEGFGIAVNKSNESLLEELNKGLNAIKVSGEYQNIYNKWFSK